MKQEYINSLLEKYWAAETTLEEERLIRELYRSEKIPSSPENEIFGYFDSITEKSYTKELNIATPKTRIFNMKFLLSIAASLIMVASSIMLLRTNQPSNVTVINNPDQAIEVTLAALNMMNGSMVKSEDAVKKNLKQFEKTRIFNF